MNDIFPQAGDVVICTDGREIGGFAVLEGQIGHRYDDQMICYSASAFRDNERVSCSGGPAFYVETGKLIATGLTHRQRFWRWRDGRAGAGNGVDYHVEVPIWELKLEESHRYFQATSVEEVVERRTGETIDWYNKTSVSEPDISKGKQYLLYRADHQVSYHNYPRKFGSAAVPSDSSGQRILRAYQTYSVMFVWENHDPLRSNCNYQYIGDGYAFETREKFDAYCIAYNLEVIEESPGKFAVIPNANVDSWKPLRWVEV